MPKFVKILYSVLQTGEYTEKENYVEDCQPKQVDRKSLWQRF